MKNSHRRTLACFIFMLAGVIQHKGWGQTTSCQPNTTINPQARTMCGVDCATNTSFCSVDYLNYCTFNTTPNTYTCTKPGMNSAMTFYFDSAAQLYRANMASISPPPTPAPTPAPQYESWFDPRTGILCDKDNQAKTSSCAQDMRDGSFVWDKSTTPDLLRVEYKFDIQAKRFRGFKVFKKDGTIQKVSVAFNFAFSHYLFCTKGEHPTCQEFQFERSSGVYQRAGRFLVLAGVPTTGANRMLVVLLQWRDSSSPLWLTVEGTRGFMRDTFVPLIDSDSCGNLHVTYDVVEPIVVTSDDLTMDRLIPLIGLDLSRYDTVMIVMPTEGAPVSGSTRLYGAPERITSGGVTKWVGWFNVWDRDLGGYNLPGLMQNYLHSFGVQETADSWECGAVADGLGATPAGCRTSENGDVYDVMGEPDTNRSGYNAWFKDVMDWAHVITIANPVTERGIYKLPLLESCEVVSGIRVHLETGRDYLLDYSSVANWIEQTWYPDSGIALRRIIDDGTTGTSLIDTTPASRTDPSPLSNNQDNRDAMLAVGRTFDTLAGILIWPIRKVRGNVDVYIGPPDSGVGPTVSLTASPTRVNLLNTCSFTLVEQPLINVVIEVTDDTAPDGRPVLEKETVLPGGGALASSLGEGGIDAASFSVRSLDADRDLGIGHHRLYAISHDVFGHDGTSPMVDVYVDPPTPPVESFTIAPTSITLPQPGSSTSSIVFTTHINPSVAIARVELYRADGTGPGIGTGPVIFMGSGLRAADGTPVYTWTVDPVDLGRGNFYFYVRAQDACSNVYTSTLRMVHVE